MSGKNQSPIGLQSPSGPIGMGWQSAAPFPLTPQQYASGFGTTATAGTNVGAMTGTSTIYTNVIDVSRMDNVGLEVVWTGTPTGTIQIMASNSGINFEALTFDPSLAQPAGAAGGYLISLNQLPFKFFMVQYTNSSGTGTIQVFGHQKDLN